ncbi:MAG: hypothetical protein JSS65_12380 [Armatimonadetes bacterium]|nr:hypothetical protein [Armatimonadota bacterium]
MLKTLRIVLALAVVGGIVAGCGPEPVVESPTAGKSNTGPGAAPGAKVGQTEAPKEAGK